MARQYFTNNIDIDKGYLYITDKEYKHLTKVMRKKLGDIISVNEYKTEIIEITEDKVTCKIIEKNVKQEYKLNITLFQGLPKSDKLEYIIQKTVEIGIDKIIPVITQNTVVKLDDKKINSKLERWNKIAYEASKQCGRTNIPEIKEPMNLRNIASEIEEYDLVLLAYENAEIHLKHVLANSNKENIKSMAIIVGPEGGFAETEVNMLLEKENVKSISLGKNILRTETAPLVLLSNILYEFYE